MKPLPLPLRIAAGLVATAVEQAQDLPRLVVEFPVTAVSQALQASMRVQQRLTELAIKGDRVLGSLRPIEEKPSWATFDEDEEWPNNGVTPLRRPDPERIPVARPPVRADGAKAPAQPHPTEPAEVTGPNVLPGYDEMSIAALRARLRNLGVDDLQALLEWENAHAARAPFVTMLSNRITTVTSR